MKIEITINKTNVASVEATWNGMSDTYKAFHDLARLAHHALDKAVRELQTAKVVVK